MKRYTVIFAILLSGVLSAGLPWSMAMAVCGDIDGEAGGYGPFDYRDPVVRAQRLPIVEERHFTPEIESLSSRYTTRNLTGDIGYTLRKSPNHHRALEAMSRLALREGTDHPRGSAYTIDCWFQRAAVFQPRDGIVRMLYGLHLKRQGKLNEALVHMQAGLRWNPDDVMISYQLGLLYLQLEDFDTARKYAEMAYGAGFPDSELRDGLRRAGHWKDD